MLNTPRMCRDAIRRKLAEDAMRRGTVDEHGGRDLPDNWLFNLLNYGPFLLAAAAWHGWAFWSALFR